MSAEPDTKRCPKCGEQIRKDVAVCGYCGTTLEDSTAAKHPPPPDGIAPHRGKMILKLAVVSGLLFFVGGWVLGCAGYFWNGTIQSILPFLVFGVPALVFGQFCGVVAIVFASRDLLRMRAGRVVKAGWWPTAFGGLVAVISVQAYWLMTGLAVRDLL